MYGWAKLMAYSCLVFISRLLLPIKLGHMHRVCLFSSCVTHDHILINYNFSMLTATDCPLFSISSVNLSGRIVLWGFPFFGSRTTFLYVTIKKIPCYFIASFSVYLPNVACCTVFIQVVQKWDVIVIFSGKFGELSLFVN